MGFTSWLGLLGLVFAGCARAATGLSSVTGLVTPVCAAPIPLTPGAPMRGSTLLGRDTLTASCVRGEAPECRFTLEVTRPSALRAALETGSFDGALALYRAGTPPGELRCVDDTPSGDARHARLDATLAPGSYLLVVDGGNGEAGDFELFAELESLPPRAEVCARAEPLSTTEPRRDSTRGATNLFGSSCGGDDGPEHVHKLVLSEPSRVRVRQQSEHDGTLSLRAVCDEPRSELACSDDGPRGVEARMGGGDAQLAASLAPGTYYVFSDAYTRDQGGDYVLTLEQERAPAPTTSALHCAEATARPPLVSGRFEIDTLTSVSALGGSCGGADAPELIFPIRVERPVTLFAQLEAAEFNAVLYLRRACDDPASELVCQLAPRIDRTPSESAPPLTVPLEPGSYALVIDGYEASDLGAATLEVLLTPRGR